MPPLSLKTLSLGVAILLLSTTVLGQAPERNLTIPSTATTTSSAPLQSSPPGGNLPSNSTNTPTTNGTTPTNKNAQNNTSHGNSTTPVKLTPVPDATGAAGAVPMPAPTGGKAKGRYGPDDDYIASAAPKAPAPMFSTFLVMSCTVAALAYGVIT
ncbi:hypothetical protein VP01_3325g1 [Puccinia sorghi]|uniref:Uncharacterized protein n=1 Tax=Puccinia sorghi TaxID=27349 RepID=A0A0L6UY35_9BASI|nr:hypothetical protein VP01_3325g1 [Puccinia sorghi]